MSEIYFNKDAGAPKHPRKRNDGFEDITSRSENFVDDFEDISSYSSEEARYNDYRYEQSARAAAVRNAYSESTAIHKRPQAGDISMSKSAARNASVRKQNAKNASKAVYTNYDYPDEQSEQPLDRPQKKKKKKKHRLLRIMTALFLAFAIFVGIIFAVAVNMINKMNINEDVTGGRVNPYIDESALYYSNDVTNILLLGVDAREGETVSRSDTMMLVSIDRAHKKIKMTSFLRDSYVEIPEHGWNKLNAASTKGGVELVMNTIEYNYKIKIDNYMLVDFVAFEELIDAIGGVSVEVTEKEASYLNRTWQKWSLTGNPLTFESGEAVELNGEEALMFCRIRKLDSDFYRTERQRRVISSVKNKVMANPLSVFDIAETVLPLVETDLSTASTMSLGMGAVTSYLKYDMAQQSIPADGTWHSERKSCGDSLVFSIDENAEILKNFIYFDQYEGKEETASLS